MSAFATVIQLEAYWRTLTTAEKSRAEVLLELTSDRLRLIAEGVDIDIDAKVAGSTAYASVARWVVMESVKRALSTPTDQPPVDSYSQTAGPYSENYKYANPSGDLWFRNTELSALGLTGSQVLSSISTSRTDIYDCYSS